MIRRTVFAIAFVVTAMLAAADGSTVIAGGDTPAAVTIDAGVAPPATAQLAPIPGPASPGSDAAGTPAIAPVPLPTVPSDLLHDPVLHPAAAWDDAEAAKRIGWPALVFALVTMLAMGLGTIGKEIPWLAWLNRGATATGLGAAAAIGAAGYNAAFTGGTWLATLMAALLAAAAFWQARRTSAPPAPPATP